MELDITDSVEIFRNVIDSSWDFINVLSEKDLTGSFFNDWAQSSWERIVESSIGPDLKVFLEPYGDGADCNIRSSRVWRPEAIPTTDVFARYVGNEELINMVDGSPVHGKMKLDRFASLRDGWPVVGKPFECAVVSDDGAVAVSIRDLRYYILV